MTDRAKLDPLGVLILDPASFYRTCLNSPLGIERVNDGGQLVNGYENWPVRKQSLQPKATYRACVGMDATRCSPCGSRQSLPKSKTRFGAFPKWAYDNGSW